MSISVRAFPIAIICVGLSACATGPVNTDNPTTTQLLFRYDELNAYLDVRRQELDRLRAQLVETEAALERQNSEIASLSRQIQRLDDQRQITAERRSELKAETQKIQLKQDATRTRLAALKAQRAELEARDSQTAPADPAADAKERARLQFEIDKLEREVTIIRTSIDSLFNAREIQLMKT